MVLLLPPLPLVIAGETDLPVSWETAGSVVSGISRSVPIEVGKRSPGVIMSPTLRWPQAPACTAPLLFWVLQRKRPLYDRLLSRVVLETGPDGSTQLRLSAAQYVPSPSPQSLGGRGSCCTVSACAPLCVSQDNRRGHC